MHHAQRFVHEQVYKAKIENKNRTKKNERKKKTNQRMMKRTIPQSGYTGHCLKCMYTFEMFYWSANTIF